MSRFIPLTILFLAVLTGCEANIRYQVAIKTSENSFKQVKGSLKVTVIGENYDSGEFVLADGVDLVPNRIYNKTESLRCAFNKIQKVNLRFTKKGDFIGGSYKIIVSSIAIMLDPSEMGRNDKSESMLLLPSKYSDVTIDHKKTETFTRVDTSALMCLLRSAGFLR